MNEQDQAVVDEQSQELVAPLTLHDQRCAQHAQKAANANWQQWQKQQACESVRIWV
jgi:hypothetical protein